MKPITKIGQCSICRSYRPLDIIGRLPEHNHLKTGNPCRGRNPLGSKGYSEAEYPIGADRDLHTVSGGLPGLGKHQ